MSTIKSSTTLTTAYQVVADTTGALVIQTGATPTTAVTVSSAQVVTLANALAEASGGTGTTIGYNGFKNRIINGAMVIDQRNAGASVTPTTANTTYAVDRFVMFTTQSSKYTAQQNAGSVTPPTGFSNYLGCTVGASANVTVAAGDFFGIKQPIEGFNTADLGWGTANAQTVTLSFWVRSSLTGTFGGSFYNSAFNRSYPYTYTISAANTWEQKTITIAGDTSGTWVGATNGIGIQVFFSLGSGSTYNGTAGAWTGSGLFSATGSTNWITTNSATFYITGVQLEKGSTATSFDYRPYGTELALCQRYFQIINAMSGASRTGGTTATMMALLLVTMRSTPTVSSYGGVITITEAGVADYTQSSTSVVIESSRASSQGAQLAVANFSGLTSQRPNFQNINGNGAAFSAEL